MFNQYPYLNLNDLNLDYILKAIKEMRFEVTNFVSINAIKYADPIQWNITSQYEKNTIVIDPVTGTAYISVAPVPAGVALTRTEFWTVVFDLGSFVTRAAQNFTSRWESDTTTTATFSTPAGAWLVWGDVLYKALVNITAGDTYVVNSNIEHFTIEDLYNAYLNTIASILALIGDLTDLDTADKTDIVSAINETVANIGDLSTLTTTDKTSVVNAINEEITDRTNADIALNEKIDNARVYANVKLYGAKGDGVTDDTQAIKDCIDANNCAYFPSGVYIVSSTIELDSLQSIFGDGCSSEIKLADNSNCNVIASKNFASLKGTDTHDGDAVPHGIVISDIRINGNYLSDMTADNVDIRNGSGAGIAMYAYGLSFDNVEVVNTPDDGIYTESATYIAPANAGNTPIYGEESVYNNVKIRYAGANGWHYCGPHDSFMNAVTIISSNRKNGSYSNLLCDWKGNCRVINSHFACDYGNIKPYASVNILETSDNNAYNWSFVNCEIEGAATPLIVGSNRHKFVNCHFFASFGYTTMVIKGNDLHFESCSMGQPSSDTDPVGRPAFVQGVAWVDTPSRNYFNILLEDTIFTNGFPSGSERNTYILTGKNTTIQLFGQYYAAGFDVFGVNSKDYIRVNGDFAAEPYLEYPLKPTKQVEIGHVLANVTLAGSQVSLYPVTLTKTFKTTPKILAMYDDKVNPAAVYVNATDFGTTTFNIAIKQNELADGTYDIPVTYIAIET